MTVQLILKSIIGCIVIKKECDGYLGLEEREGDDEEQTFGQRQMMGVKVERSEANDGT